MSRIYYNTRVANAEGVLQPIQNVNNTRDNNLENKIFLNYAGEVIKDLTIYDICDVLGYDEEKDMIKENPEFFLQLFDNLKISNVNYLFDIFTGLKPYYMYIITTLLINKYPNVISIEEGKKYQIKYKNEINTINGLMGRNEYKGGGWWPFSTNETPEERIEKIKNLINEYNKNKDKYSKKEDDSKLDEIDEEIEKFQDDFKGKNYTLTLIEKQTRQGVTKKLKVVRPEKIRKTRLTLIGLVVTVLSFMVIGNSRVHKQLVTDMVKYESECVDRQLEKPAFQLLAMEIKDWMKSTGDSESTAVEKLCKARRDRRYAKIKNALENVYKINIIPEKKIYIAHADVNSVGVSSLAIGLISGILGSLGIISEKEEEELVILGKKLEDSAQKYKPVLSAVQNQSNEDAKARKNAARRADNVDEKKEELIRKGTKKVVEFGENVVRNMVENGTGVYQSTKTTIVNNITGKTTQAAVTSEKKLEIVLEKILREIALKNINSRKINKNSIKDKIRNEQQMKKILEKIFEKHPSKSSILELYKHNNYEKIINNLIEEQSLTLSQEVDQPPPQVKSLNTVRKNQPSANLTPFIQGQKNNQSQVEVRVREPKKIKKTPTKTSGEKKSETKQTEFSVPAIKEPNATQKKEIIEAIGKIPLTKSGNLQQKAKDALELLKLQEKINDDIIAYVTTNPTEFRSSEGGFKTKRRSNRRNRKTQRRY